MSNKLRLVEMFNKSGIVSQIVPPGATSYEGVSEEDLMAEVDVLDAGASYLLCCDLPPNHANLYKDTEDRDGQEEPQSIVDTRAVRSTAAACPVRSMSFCATNS